MKSKVLFVLLCLNTVLVAFSQKRGNKLYKQDIEIDLSGEYFGNKYFGTYEGEMAKVKVNGKKEWLPNGQGTFNGYLSGSEKRNTIIFDTYDDRSYSAYVLTGKSWKSKDYSFVIDPNDYFSIETAVMMNRYNEMSGGAIIKLYFDEAMTDYINISLKEFRKENYNPTTATLLEKSAYITEKTAFNNLQIEGYVGGGRVNEKFKPLGLDYKKYNKLKIEKKGNELNVYINEYFEGKIEIPKEVGLRKIALDKDETHDVFYDFITIDRTILDVNNKISYQGFWSNGNFGGAEKYDGTSTLKIGDNTWSGVFTSNQLNGYGEFKNSTFEYYGDFERNLATGKGMIVTPDYQFNGRVENYSARGEGEISYKKMVLNFVNCSKNEKWPISFKGEVLGDKPNGQGRMTFCNGDTLTGIWNNFQFTGNGKLKLLDGSIYSGDWKLGKKDGMGELKFPDGNVLRGRFENDGFSGFGKISMTDGAIYEGELIAGKPFGKGKITYSNGDVLSGNWNEYGFNGSGRRSYEPIDEDGLWGDFWNDKEKICYEEGNWVNGKLNGSGIKVFNLVVFSEPDFQQRVKAKYTGEFKNGIFEGKGKLEFFGRSLNEQGDGHTIVDATWVNGEARSGTYEITYFGEEGITENYSGDMKGLGLIGDGYGKIKDPFYSYEGQFKNGYPNGQGTRINSNGQIEKGNFINGEFQKPFSCKEVKIGDQVWMAENLAVTKFRNGDPIPEARSPEEWSNAGKNRKPAFCYVKNEETSVGKYGILYNWYAVYDSRGLAPEGWRIPAEEDFNQLFNYARSEIIQNEKEEEYLKSQGISTSENYNKWRQMQKMTKTKQGFNTPSHYFAGTKLKSKSGWEIDNSYKYDWNGTDIYGFNAKPSFQRYHNGEFQNYGRVSYWSSNYKGNAENEYGVGFCGYDQYYCGILLTIQSGFGSSDNENAFIEYNALGNGLNVRLIKK
jgi:uncharacterized protein (TIGR02145 family)